MRRPSGAAVPPLEGYQAFFDARLRRLWPLTAHLARLLDGRLMGGTALALHLRHRVSEDIDIMTFKTFSGRHLADRMKKHIDAAYGDDTSFDILVQTAEDDGYFALLDGVKLDVFRARKTESVTAEDMRWLAPPTVIDNVPVGSLPDILASKLDVIMYRPKLRDYVDLACIDQLTSHTLELGITYYKLKYGYDRYPRPSVIRRILSLLESPGQLMVDERFEDQRSDVIGYLEERVGDVRAYLEEADDMDDRSVPADAWRADADSVSAAATRQGTCSRWMPRSRKYCVLSPNHRGGCRSRRP